MLTRAEGERVEALARSYITTRSRDFPALRESGEMPLDLLSRGALEHPNSGTRRSCLILLDHLGDDEHAAVFITALHADPVPRNRRHALHGLTCDKCKANTTCIDVTEHVRRTALTDPNAKVRRLAERLLKDRARRLRLKQCGT